MTRGIKKYRPASELKDHHDLIKIAAGIRTNDRRPAGLKKKMTYHVTELLKLFACDPTLGVRDPNLEKEEERRREEKRIRAEQVARSKALEAHVQAADAAAEVSGGVPDYGKAAASTARITTATEMISDVRRCVEGAISANDVYMAHGLSIRATQVLGSLVDGPLTSRRIALAAGRRKIAQEIEKAFSSRGVTLLPDSPGEGALVTPSHPR